MKTKIYAALALAIAASISADYASARTGSSTHVDGSVQFPPSRARLVRHTIRLHIPQGSSPLSQLSIYVPEGLKVKNNITVTDQAGRELNTNVSTDGNKVLVKFLQPVTPDSNLEIDLNSVKIKGVSNAWFYRIDTKIVGSDTDLSIGVAQVRVY